MDNALIIEATNAIELIDIFLYSSSVERFEDIDDKHFPAQMVQQNSLGIEADFMDPIDHGGIENHGVIRAKVRIGTRMVINDEDKDGSKKTKVLSEIQACFAAIYLKKHDVSEKAIEEFMRFNVIHNVWPFWREYAFRISRESKLPQPIIPFFSGNDFDKDSENLD